MKRHIAVSMPLLSLTEWERWVQAIPGPIEAIAPHPTDPQRQIAVWVENEEADTKEKDL